MKNLLFKIIRAWWYFFAGKNRELMRIRLLICESCPFRAWIVCKDCGCELHAKGSDPEEQCPQGFWPNKNGHFNSIGGYIN